MIKFKVIYFQFLIASLFALSLGLTKPNPQIIDMICFFMICLFVTYGNWKELERNFEIIYNWGLFDKKFAPAKKIAGIEFGEYHLIERQKKEIHQIGYLNSNLPHYLKIIVILSSFAFYQSMLATDNSLVPTFVSIIFLIFFLKGKYWGMFQLCVHLTIIPVALFFDSNNPKKIIYTTIFIILYFISIKSLNSYFYQKLNNQKVLRKIKLTIPFIPIFMTIFIFLLLNFIFPHKEGLFDIQTRLWNKTKSTITKNLLTPTKELTNKNKLSKLQKVAIKRRVPNLYKQIEQKKELRNKVNNQSKTIKNQEEMKDYIKNVNKLEKMNQDIMKEILINSHEFSDKEIKSFENLPEYNKQLQNFKKLKLNNNELIEAIQLLQRDNNFNKEDSKKLEELIFRTNGTIPGNLKNTESSRIIESLQNNINQNRPFNDSEVKSIQKKLNDYAKYKSSNSNKEENKNFELAKLKEIEDSINQAIDKNVIQPNQIENIEKLKNDIHGLIANSKNSSRKDSQQNIDQKLTDEEKNKVKSAINAALKRKDIEANQKRILQKLNKKLEASDLPFYKENEIKEYDNENKRHKELVNKELEIFEDSKKKTHKNQQFFKRFDSTLKFIFCLLVITLLYFLKDLKLFFGKEKIEYDETIYTLDDISKKEIKALILNAPTNFRTKEQEIIECYQFFHQIINKLFYQNEIKDFSPPPRSLNSKESLLTIRFKDIANELSRSFAPIFYGNLNYKDLKTDINQFRKRYKEFMRLASRMVK